MKRGGILHPELSQLIASLGHSDYIVMADKGYPIPESTHRINLGFSDDHPTIPDVLKTINEEFIIDRIIFTQEMEDVSPERLSELKDTYTDHSFEKVMHHQLKQIAETAQGAIKTGDTCPYGNIIIVSG